MSAVVTPVTAAGPQQLSCGHHVDKGERLYDLALTTLSASLCAACVHQIARHVTDLEQQPVHRGTSPRPGDPDWTWHSDQVTATTR